MTANLPYFYFLEPTIQSYDWGNTDGIIQRFLYRRTSVAPAKMPMAELWQGDHPKSPSLIRPFLHNQNDTTTQDYTIALNEAILKNPAHFLGKLFSRGSTSLPFLFKILDAAKPLSIQAHPDKALAEKLHKSDPLHYPDSNHKPEIAISLNKVEAMAGFRPLADLQAEITRLPLLNKLFQVENQRIDSTEVLRRVYSNLMLSDSNQIESISNELLNALNKIQTNDRDIWFRRLIEFYGNRDCGIFTIYLFNYITLNAGQAIFLDANQPHAYLKGEILECMASSDNVVRGGLTSKFKDIPTLLSMLNYEAVVPKIILPTTRQNSAGRAIYDTIAKEFQVSKIDAKNVAVQLQPLSIVIILEGNAELEIIRNSNEHQTIKVPIQEATILFIPGDLRERQIQISIKATIANTAEKSTIFEATTLL